MKGDNSLTEIPVCPEKRIAENEQDYTENEKKMFSFCYKWIRYFSIFDSQIFKFKSLITLSFKI